MVLAVHLRITIALQRRRSTDAVVTSKRVSTKYSICFRVYMLCVKFAVLVECLNSRLFPLLVTRVRDLRAGHLGELASHLENNSCTTVHKV